MIPYSRQSISEQDIQAVVDVLRSDFLTQGTMVPAFEEAICKYTGATYGIAVNSGTSALHLACRALDLGAGDILWTTPITYVASANCAVYCSASVDFVDIKPDTYNMSVEALAKKLDMAEKSGRLPKVIIPVHFGGLACDMEAISKLCKKYGCFVIEDACHAIGGRYNGENIGNCRYSDITVFSFHPVKSITTGEGGMAVTKNPSLAEKMALLRSHGITRDTDYMTHKPDGPWYYQQIELGYNYRMTDIQAALGVSQLKRLDDFIFRRQEIAIQYNQMFEDLPVRPQSISEQHYSALHLYVIRIQIEKLKKSHLQVFKEMREAGIGVNLHYIPIHTQPFYRAMGFKNGDFPEAEQYYSEAISLPVYPGLKNEQVMEVGTALRHILK